MQAPNVWGVSLVTSTAMVPGTVLVADLRSAAVVHLRQVPTVETSRGGYQEFKHNVSLFRAEERLALAIVRPSALCLITN
ncbi:MAG: Phage capsid family [Actinomycetota bacterium]|jgi:HK97 family phage major capsid protein|nr:Phage capsid family [Actinomycetota bacterium]